jgi:hypothetical protein
MDWMDGWMAQVMWDRKCSVDFREIGFREGDAPAIVCNAIWKAALGDGPGREVREEGPLRPSRQR